MTYDDKRELAETILKQPADIEKISADLDFGYDSETFGEIAINPQHAKDMTLIAYFDAHKPIIQATHLNPEMQNFQGGLTERLKLSLIDGLNDWREIYDSVDKLFDPQTTAFDAAGRVISCRMMKDDLDGGPVIDGTVIESTDAPYVAPAAPKPEAPPQKPKAARATGGIFSMFKF